MQDSQERQVAEHRMTALCPAAAFIAQWPRTNGFMRISMTHGCAGVGVTAGAAGGHHAPPRPPGRLDPQFAGRQWRECVPGEPLPLGMTSLHGDSR